MEPGIQLLGKVTPEYAEILSPDALAFVAGLAREFEPTRRSLLKARVTRQAEIDAGHMPDFPAATRGIRETEWQVGKAPKDLLDRRVELTGPSADPRMVINALNSGAQVYMTDFEDAHSPHWSRTLQGQINVRDASAGTIRHVTAEGREYKLNEELSTLVVRPRGWHLPERHLLIDGQAISASLFDFGLSFFHNARSLMERGSGPYFYLPKLQSHLEARLWNDVFNFAQDRLDIPRGTIKTTILIEHILAAFEMEEMLYELKDHITGLNLGRWDYIFSFIKTFCKYDSMVFPDRAQVNMATHFLTSVAEGLVQACHKRGAHAMGGMSTYIPRRDDPDANEQALGQVRMDKEREGSQGFDGAWVAHPGLVPIVQEVFEASFKGINQLSHMPEVKITASDLLDVPQGEITEAGMRSNISVTLHYLDEWIAGNGAVAINGVMEDTATAEISRSQLWQWTWTDSRLSDSRIISPALYLELRADELSKLAEGRDPESMGNLDKATELLDELVVDPNYTEFLTIPGNRYLE